MDKTKIRLAAFKFLESFDSNIRTKFDNISAKTGRYDVPDELFQKRCKRSNRVLISWKTVLKNNLTYEQLHCFVGGVVVEFVNEDFFEQKNQNNPLFLKLKEKIGSDDLVSSIITIRSEFGFSGASEQKNAFEKLINNTEIMYKNKKVIINYPNYKKYIIKRKEDITYTHTGNDKWTGFLYVCIKGGDNQYLEVSHTDIKPRLFNPACEFATDDVCEDINLVMAYFAFMSIDEDSLDTEKKNEYKETLSSIRTILSDTEYDSGNLLDYCNKHLCLKMCPGKLYDPIQAEEINIMDFAIDDKEDSRNIDFTHNEAVNKGKFYWDSHKQCILSPARPTNVFWSKHWSNMMQQNCYLEEFIEKQEAMVEKRNRLLRQNVTV